MIRRPGRGDVATGANVVTIALGALVAWHILRRKKRR